jgi:DNA adenine methylase
MLSSDIKVRGTIYASDVNPHLINFYTMVRDSPTEVIEMSRTLEPTTDPEASYYDIRSKFNTLPSKQGPLAAAMFLYLNKAGFRGVYREGPHGFNVPYGHYKASYKTPDTEILQISPLLQRVVFRCQGFEESLALVQEKDFVYLDPPYVPMNATSFVGYVAGGFQDHARLFELTKALPCRFLMSNADVALVRESFPGYNVKTITCRRAIHSKDPSSTAQEVLITKSS